jgi:hypothetical protein
MSERVESVELKDGVLIVTKRLKRQLVMVNQGNK